MQRVRSGVCMLLTLLLLVFILPCGGRATGETLSQGQQNIVKRARQILEIQWTPRQDVWQWGYGGVFEAGTTYTGIPYGQPVHTGYVGFEVTLSEFLEAVNDADSEFYSDYSYFNKIAPYYSMDCSGFVSYAWGLSGRMTTSTAEDVAEVLEEQDIQCLEVGDCLNKAGVHMVLVTDVVRDDAGAVVSVQLMEETPGIARCTRYGQDGSRSLERLSSYYLDSGYVICRYPGRDSVRYVHDCAVPIDGDTCPACRAEGLPFVDVRRDAWYQEAVRCVYESGLMSGTDSRHFSPGDTMTRGMFTAALGRLAGVESTAAGLVAVTIGDAVPVRATADADGRTVAVCSRYTPLVLLGTSRGGWYQVQCGDVTGYVQRDLVEPYTGTLTDLRTDAYYSAGVQWACLTGIVGGNSDGSFRAEEAVTREQMCVMLYHYTAAYGIDLPQVREKQVFRDDGDIGAYAKTAVYALQQAGVISGMEDGTFSPKATATRAQVAQIFQQFLMAAEEIN